MIEIRVEDLSEIQKDKIKETAWNCGMSAIDPYEQDDTDVRMFLDLYNGIHKVLFQGFL